MIINLDDERRKRLEEEAKRNGRTPEEQLSVMQDLFAACGFPEFDAKPQPQVTVEQIVEMMMSKVRPVIDEAHALTKNANELARKATEQAREAIEVAKRAVEALEMLTDAAEEELGIDLREELERLWAHDRVQEEKYEEAMRLKAEQGS